MRFPLADLYCGAGGTSDGALDGARQMGLEPELTAVNHWPRAIATHLANHPDARHLCTGLDNVNPRELYGAGELRALWASPECTHHSQARGGKPIHDQSRATAWCVVKWADALLPPTILIENVPEFKTWGPLDARGRPLKARKGEIFASFLNNLRSLGYRVETCELVAADYGDPTTRRRLFIQAQRGRRKIVWPEATHASANALQAPLRPWVPARDIIDWTIEGRWIDEMKPQARYGGLPLSPNSLQRIQTGFLKFGLKPFTVANFGERPGQTPRTHAVDAPFPTVTSRGCGNLVEPFLVQMNHAGGDRSRSLDGPLPTVCGNRGEFALIESALLPQGGGGALRPVSEPAPTIATDGAVALVEPYLVKYYGTAGAQSLDDPLDTVTTKDRHALVSPVVRLEGVNWRVRYRYRMLKAHELAGAQGFRKDYVFTGNNTEQVKQIGNAVPRRLARALFVAAVSQNPDVSWLRDS